MFASLYFELDTEAQGSAEGREVPEECLGFMQCQGCFAARSFPTSLPSSPLWNLQFLDYMSPWHTEMKEADNDLALMQPRAGQHTGY
jgi:hypothetical protein